MTKVTLQALNRINGESNGESNDSKFIWLPIILGLILFFTNTASNNCA